MEVSGADSGSLSIKTVFRVQQGFSLELFFFILRSSAILPHNTNLNENLHIKLGAYETLFVVRFQHVPELLSGGVVLVHTETSSRKTRGFQLFIQSILESTRAVSPKNRALGNYALAVM